MTNSSTSPLKPPVAEVRPTTRSFHGQNLEDDYHWLRADNWQEVMRAPDVLDADIRNYLEAENAYTKQALSETEDLQATLFEEMKGRIKEDDSTVPAKDGPFAYFVSFIEGGQHPRFCRESRDGGAEEVLLDGNKLAEGHAYFSFGGVSHSPDHKRLAYGTDVKGSEFYTINIREAATGENIDDELEQTTGGAVWCNDNQTLYYTKLDDNHRSRWVYRHKIGSPQEDDELIYEEADNGFFVNVGKTLSGRFIIIGANDHQTSEVRLLDADDPTAEPRLVAERKPGHEYSVEDGGTGFVILTNKDGAEDFKLVSTGYDNPAPENWKDIVPHEHGRLIVDVSAFKNHLVRLERLDGLPRIVIQRLSDGDEHVIEFAEEAYSLGLSSGYEFDTTNLCFSYSSMTTPGQTFDYDLDTRDRILRKTQEVPSGHNIDDYVTRRFLAPAHDGETVPVTLLYHRLTKLDGSAPVLLYGYGSYGIAMPASFSTTRLSLVDRGFIYAIAHIRGGKDKGYRWYKEGRREKKTNTFRDFISAGEFLVTEGFTARGNCVGHGGSAGGMLMGAVANMAPDLFKGIIAEVPFVDVLNTILDETLPLTPPEWPEWGNPLADVEAFNWIRDYSPYDNVAPQSYPHILALGGLTDPRVTYWEPAKWVAKLRACKQDENLLLLKTNMEAGHGGASGRFDRLKEVALSYAFALKITDRTNIPGFGKSSP